MRLLLDQDVREELVSVFRALSHEATHVSTLGMSRTPDAQLAVVARDYDVFVTLDLHRQEREWLAVHLEIIASGVRVLRVRLPKREHGEDLRLAIIRQALRHMERWVEAFCQHGPINRGLRTGPRPGEWMDPQSCSCTRSSAASARLAARQDMVIAWHCNALLNKRRSVGKCKSDDEGKKHD